MKNEKRLSRKKKVTLVVGAFGFLALIAIFLVWTNLGRIAKGVIEYYGPTILGVPVRVSSVALSPLSGRGEIHNLLIGNPSGYSVDHLMRLRKAGVEVDLKSLRTNVIHIQALYIDGADLVWEGDLSNSNFLQVQKHAAAFPHTESKNGSEKKIVIDRVVIINTKATAQLKGFLGAEIPFPNIEMSHLGTPEKGLAAGEVVNQIFAKLSSEIILSLSRSPQIINKFIKGGQSLIHLLGK